MDPQEEANSKLGSTCDFVWPGPGCTCIDLRWLALTMLKIKFAYKSMQFFTVGLPTVVSYMYHMRSLMENKYTALDN